MQPVSAAADIKEEHAGLEPIFCGGINVSDYAPHMFIPETCISFAIGTADKPFPSREMPITSSTLFTISGYLPIRLSTVSLREAAIEE